MKLLNGILSIALLTSIVSAAGNVLELTEKNFDQLVVNSGRPSLVEFYASWCGHCKNLAPIYEELADSYVSKKDKIQIAKIDADQHRSIGKKYGIKGFPTIKFFDGKGGEPVPYEQGRSIDAFQEFVAKQTGVKAGIKKAAPSDVVMLTDASFPQIVLDKSKDVLVAFTASWCGHCKNLAPTYEQLATVFSGDKNVVIAKMDTTQPGAENTAGEYKVQGYPTIKFFPKDETEPIDYNLGRSLNEFISFINENAGTHRTESGLLDSTAGVITDFDDVIADLASITEDGVVDFISKVKSIQSQADTAKYYAKVIEKTASLKKDYLKKEINRLSNILKKGHIVREKSDQFTIRKNVLSDILKKIEAAEISSFEPKDEL
ncbi:thioredoxin-like protein [Dipodascopsis uninucleata]